MSAPGRGDALDVRRRRLRLLTAATIGAWLTALLVTGVPALAVAPGSHAGAAAVGSPAPAATPKLNAKPSTAPRGTAKPSSSPKGGPKSTPTPTPDPAATPTADPTATPRPKPSSTPRPKPAGSPRPTHKPHPTQTPPGAGAGGGWSQGSGPSPAPGGTGARATATPPAEDVFTVPGAGALLEAESAAERAGGDGGGPVEAEVYLDVRLAASVDWLAPAALLAIPALLIALSLLAQVLGGLLWIPLTNRVLGARASRS